MANVPIRFITTLNGITNMINTVKKMLRLSGLLTFILLLTSLVNAQDKASDFYFPLPESSSEIFSSDHQKFSKQVVVRDLDKPWSVAFLPDGRALITEITGDVRLVENGKLVSKPVENVPEVLVHGQGGLLDVLLHPNFEENGWIYFSYSIPDENQRGITAIVRFKLDGNKLVEREDLYEGTPFTRGRVHFGSRMAIDADGYLYFTIGDRGEKENAQKLTTSTGKTHRLHDDGKVPTDNPFVNEEGAIGSIYNFGHRNQQGMAIHPETGKIWTHEHGPRGGDEINIEQKGANYGWPEATFGINYNGTIITKDTTGPGMTQPIHYWDPSIAPSGMDFVHNSRYEGWEGDLMVGSLKFARIHRLRLDDDNNVLEEEILMEGEMGRARDVYMAPDGFIYLLDESAGHLIRLVPEGM